MAETGAPQEPAWASLPDAELLRLRICEVHVPVDGSAVWPQVLTLMEELKAKGLTFVPALYFGDEWFSPEDVPAIAIPFYLSHPRLIALEKRFMLEVEGGDATSFLRLLRHECGHAIEHAYGLHRRPQRRAVFGPRSADYDPDTYRPQPYSRSFVRNLPNWYAQAHPDEDFAETFAVWLDPQSQWAEQYKGWKALTKLQWLDALMQKIAQQPPLVTGGPRPSNAARMQTTLENFYKRRRRLYATDTPDFFDRDLTALFVSGGQGPKAHAFLRRQRKLIIDVVAEWTDERKITVELLLKKLMDRTQQLDLTLGRDETVASMHVCAFVATLVTNFRFTGKFKRTV